MARQEEILLDTAGHGRVEDITTRVRAIVLQSGVRIGLVHIFHVGSTGALGLIEFEPGLERDLPEMLDRLIPASAAYGHEQRWHDGNGHSHLQATLLGQSLTVPVSEGDLLVGEWQQIFLLECDVRPRQRRIIVTVMGE